MTALPSRRFRKDPDGAASQLSLHDWASTTADRWSVRKAAAVIGLLSTAAWLAIWLLVRYLA
jgi:hypothetical protein